MGPIVIGTSAAFVIVPIVPILKPGLHPTGDLPGEGEPESFAPVVDA